MAHPAWPQMMPAQLRERFTIYLTLSLTPWNTHTKTPKHLQGRRKRGEKEEKKPTPQSCTEEWREAVLPPAPLARPRPGACCAGRERAGMICSGAAALCPRTATSLGSPLHSQFQFTVKQVRLSVCQPSGDLPQPAPLTPTLPSAGGGMRHRENRQKRRNSRTDPRAREELGSSRPQQQVCWFKTS